MAIKLEKIKVRVCGQRRRRSATLTRATKVVRFFGPGEQWEDREVEIGELGRSSDLTDDPSTPFYRSVRIEIRAAEIKVAAFCGDGTPVLATEDERIGWLMHEFDDGVADSDMDNDAEHVRWLAREIAMHDRDQQRRRPRATERMDTDNPHLKASIPMLFDQDGRVPEDVDLEVVVAPLMPDKYVGLRLRKLKPGAHAVPFDGCFMVNYEEARRLGRSLLKEAAPTSESSPLTTAALHAAIVEYFAAGRNAAAIRYDANLDSVEVLDAIDRADQRCAAARRALETISDLSAPPGEDAEP